jgi:hypothetical protein
MVDEKIFTNSGRTTREELLDHLRPGDIHTHMYNDRQLELVDRLPVRWRRGWLRRGGAACCLMSGGGGSFLWPVAALRGVGFCAGYDQHQSA